MIIPLAFLWLVAVKGQAQNRNSDSGTCAGKDASCAAGSNNNVMMMQIGWKPQRKNPSLSPEEESLWFQALREANMKKEKISPFGQQVVKYPRTLVERLLSEKRNTTHKHKYNMMGRITGDQYFAAGKVEEEKRQWAVDYAKAKFTDRDIFVCTGYHGKWQPLGDFDKSSELGNRHHHQFEYYEGCPQNKLDLVYWRIMMSSAFTLCPGGDGAWSMRTYEAALAGTICVIKSHDEDWRATNSTYQHTALQKVLDLFKYELTSDPHVFNQTVADENLRIFIRYLTFIEGDNTPP